MPFFSSPRVGYDARCETDMPKNGECSLINPCASPKLDRVHFAADPAFFSHVD
jgi:hypothetical protein